VTAKSVLVTGGTGFIGAALARRLVGDGRRVRVLDNGSRGSASRLADLGGAFEYVEADIRDAHAVGAAAKGMDAVYHLAYVNGTEFFYEKPDLVLEVGVKGMLNVIDACMENGVGELILASSSEVYQTPATVPTPETAPLIVPDPTNPRYSYGGGKIISELLAINYGRKHFDRVVIFRPHNVYGPDMGWEHVLPQFVLRMKELTAETSAETVEFPIQGTGDESRSFIYIDDFIDGLMLAADKGEHLGIYHIGTEEEITVREVAELVGGFYGRQVRVRPGPLQKGSTPRRCPDISKLAALGFAPKTALRDGLPLLARWYDENAQAAPRAAAAGIL